MLPPLSPTAYLAHSLRDAMKIRPYTPKDWSAVEEIYWQGIKTGMATFETEPKSQDSWQKNSIKGSQIVAEDSDGHIAAWACLWLTSERNCYSGVAEVSIYVRETDQGRGLGTQMLEAMNDLSEKLGIWTLTASIFEENIGSVKCHERAGYKILGLRERIGKREGKWHSTYFMERRSKLSKFD